MDYKDVWDYQELLLNQNADIKLKNRKLRESIPVPNYLLFTEHPHVYTMGKSGDENHLLVNQKSLQEEGIRYYRINRGGDITYHGPGQVVCYPILDLENFFTDIGRYLRSLEEVVIRTLGDYGLEGQRSNGETGVWLNIGTPSARKICAMGIRASRWITMHGFALNVNTDLEYFKRIIPCGIHNKQVTSLHKELGVEISTGDIKSKLGEHFSEIFQTTFSNTP